MAHGFHGRLGFSLIIRDFGFVIFAIKQTELVLLQIEPIWDKVPGAMHLKISNREYLFKVSSKVC